MINVTTQDLKDRGRIDQLVEELREVEGLEPHLQHMLQNGAAHEVKVAILRIVASRQLEQKRQQLDGSSDLLQTPVPEGADLQTLERYETALSQRAELLENQPLNEELEARRQAVADQLSTAVLATFAEEEQKMITSPVQETRKAEYRRALEQLLQLVANRVASLQLTAEKLEQIRQDTLEQFGSHVNRLPAEQLVALMAPVTAETPEDQRLLLGQTRENLEQIVESNAAESEARATRRAELDRRLLALKVRREELMQLFPKAMERPPKPESFFGRLFTEHPDSVMRATSSRFGQSFEDSLDHLEELLTEGGKGFEWLKERNQDRVAWLEARSGQIKAEQAKIETRARDIQIMEDQRTGALDNYKEYVEAGMPGIDEGSWRRKLLTTPIREVVESEVAKGRTVDEVMENLADQERGLLKAVGAMHYHAVVERAHEPFGTKSNSPRRNRPRKGEKFNQRGGPRPSMRNIKGKKGK